MASPLRMLLVATALLTTGALQVAAASGEDACCEGETDAGEVPCPDCPPGLACGCCPLRAVEAPPLGTAPARPPGVAIAVVAVEPSLGASVTDVFHPPRG